MLPEFSLFKSDSICLRLRKIIVIDLCPFFRRDAVVLVKPFAQIKICTAFRTEWTVGLNARFTTDRAFPALQGNHFQGLIFRHAEDRVQAFST